ncbi:hypothetical protein WA026_003966 [Henosepilachna vigintioctopunctata]|uniref:Uncharacterized protein n=1 Tax=Henosepilachna vigintioctopunctata TaxID=420089 RepID=A0AAW1UEV6_9CUCU
MEYSFQGLFSFSPRKIEAKTAYRIKFLSHPTLTPWPYWRESEVERETGVLCISGKASSRGQLSGSPFPPVGAKTILHIVFFIFFILPLIAIKAFSVTKLVYSLDCDVLRVITSYSVPF